ncbi:MAG: type II secretion system protein [Candidatus Paceibacterota bacterium]
MLKAFTLIELLVVVAIIGILASLVMVSLNSARAKARDMRRLSDLRALANALYLYADDNKGNFPSIPGGPAVCIGTSESCWDNGVASVAGSASLMTMLDPYISEFPKDPKVNSGLGDRYLYFYPLATPGTYHCSALPWPNGRGPYILWRPDLGQPFSNTQCKNMTFDACCSGTGCIGGGRYCAYAIQ